MVELKPTASTSIEVAIKTTYTMTEADQEIMYEALALVARQTDPGDAISMKRIVAVMEQLKEETW